MRPMMYSDMLFELMPQPHDTLIQADATVRSPALRFAPSGLLPSRDSRPLVRPRHRCEPQHGARAGKKRHDEEEEEEEEEEEASHESGGDDDLLDDYDDGRLSSGSGGAHARRRLSPKAQHAAWVGAALGQHPVDVVGWDYSSAHAAHYEAVIKKHVPLMRKGRRFVMSFGLWTWNRFWTALPWVMDSLEASVKASFKMGVSQVYVSMWLDDGAEVRATTSHSSGCSSHLQTHSLTPRRRRRRRWHR